MSRHLPPVAATPLAFVVAQKSCHEPTFSLPLPTISHHNSYANGGSASWTEYGEVVDSDPRQQDEGEKKGT